MQRRIAMLAYPDAQILDITGPLEAFAYAGRILEANGRPDAGYRIELLAREAGPLATSSGLELVARPLAKARGPFDTLLVAGGRGTPEALRDAALLRWIRRQAPRARRIGSVCSGAFLLAQAGLLDGRRATTHWANCEQLARHYPKVRVEADRIYVRDGRVYSSAGVTAGIDLALALIEEDHGRELALSIARSLVVFLKRPGGQSQFSAQLAHQLADREPLRDLQTWIQENPEADLSVEALAKRVGMSPRNFARVFTREVGATPARFVERVRVEAARRRLEESRGGVEAVADACGFGSPETMRRAFLRNVRVTPLEYRNRFHGPSGEPRGGTARTRPSAS